MTRKPVSTAERVTVCPGCEGEFEKARADQVYCEPACRQRAYRARHRVERPVVRTAAEREAERLERVMSRAARKSLERWLDRYHGRLPDYELLQIAGELPQLFNLRVYGERTPGRGSRQPSGG